MHLIEKLQRSPRYIPDDVAFSVSRFDVCRLHERADANQVGLPETIRKAVVLNRLRVSGWLLKP